MTQQRCKIKKGEELRDGVNRLNCSAEPGYRGPCHGKECGKKHWLCKQVAKTGWNKEESGKRNLNRHKLMDIMTVTLHAAAAPSALGLLSC